MKGKLRLLLWVGIVVLFVPFFGVPGWLRTTLTILIGLTLVYLAYTLKYAYKKLKFELRDHSMPAQSTTEIHG